MPAKINPDASSARKMLELYMLLLFSSRQYTLTALAEILQCSKPTVQRLMTEIELFEPVEQGKKGKERWFQIKRLCGNKKIAVMFEGIQQIQFCKDIVPHLLPEGFKQEINKAVQHVASILPDETTQQIALEPIARSYIKGEIDYTPFHLDITKLMQAIPKKRMCNVIYHSLSSDCCKEFHIAPMRLLSHNGALYVECWRIKQTEHEEIIQPMILAVHRIKSLEPTRKTHCFTEPPQSKEGDFGMIKSERIGLVVKFDKSVATYVAERKWSNDQKIIDLPSGDIELTFTTSNETEALSWILSFGSNAELTFPEKLRYKIKKLLSSTMKHYS